MIEKKDEIGKLGAEVLLIAFDKQSLLDTKMMLGLQVPFQLVFDFTKETYRRWGLGRTSRWKSYLSPTLSFRYLKLLLKGEKFLGFAPDMFQLGGDFIIDKNGNIAFAYRMKNNGDRVGIGQLLSELKAIS